MNLSEEFKKCEFFVDLCVPIANDLVMNVVMGFESEEKYVI